MRGVARTRGRCPRLIRFFRTEDGEVVYTVRCVLARRHKSICRAMPGTMRFVRESVWGYPYGVYDLPRWDEIARGRFPEPRARIQKQSVDIRLPEWEVGMRVVVDVTRVCYA